MIRSADEMQCGGWALTAPPSPLMQPIGMQPIDMQPIGMQPETHTAYGTYNTVRRFQSATFANRVPHEPPCEPYFCASESESANTTIW